MHGIYDWILDISNMKDAKSTCDNSAVKTDDELKTNSGRPHQTDAVVIFDGKSIIDSTPLR